MRSCSTPVCPNASPVRSNALSIDACRSKCLSDTLKCALARRLSYKTHFRSVEMRSRSTPVDPHAFLVRSNALSLDACRPKRLSDTIKCALARRLSIKMRSKTLSLDACRSKSLSDTLKCALARRLSLQTLKGAQTTIFVRPERRRPWKYCFRRAKRRCPQGVGLDDRGTISQTL